MLKKNRILAAAISFLVVVVLTIAAWKFYEPSRSKIAANTSPSVGSDSSTQTALSPTPVSAARVGQTTESIRASTQSVSSGTVVLENTKRPMGPLGENLRRLLNSNDLTKIDYAESRIRPWCMVSAKQASERATVLARMAASIARDKQQILSGAPRNFDNGGGASYDQRVAAMDRFHELCKISTEGNAVMGEEFDRIKLKPEFTRRQSIASMFVNAEIDLNSARIKDALETMVRAPMYSSLSHVLRNNIDTSSLASAYSEDQMMGFRLFASEILVCRLGDDCGPDGFANLQFCQMMGICGNDLESGIWDYLKENKIDTTAFRQFIDQRQQALNLLDFSILKKPK
jgi:hypothetical protein